MMIRAAVWLLLLAGTAGADPLRLRAEALAEVSSPVGLLVLSADGAMRPWLSAEAVVWVGTDGGEALVIAVRAQTADGRVAARFGRFVAVAGALRPVHLDGIHGRFRLPWRFDAEVFGGVPVAPGVSGRGWDWLAGVRLARRLGDWGSVGAAYQQRRDDGERSAEELGFDGGVGVGKGTDVAAKLALDLVDPGVAEVQGSVSHRFAEVRGEAYVGYRSSAHLLPATSLFSVMGDVPSLHIGTLVTWRIAPRLDLSADLGVRQVDDVLGAELSGRAKLRLDDKGRGALGLELRRTDAIDGGWVGIRGTARVPLPYSLVASSEVELVIPDEPRGRGDVWPWALAALSWSHGLWLAGVAVEASSSPEYRRRLDVLGQLACRWEGP